MNRKIFICGNFGYRTNQIDGQTIKTRVLKDEIVNLLGEKNVLFSDTSYIRKQPIKFFKTMRRNLKDSDNTVFALGKKGLSILLPMFIKWKSKKTERRLNYVVIGGWLPDLLKSSKRLLNYSQGIDGIYVETEQMISRLSGIGVKNAYYLPNFRRSGDQNKCNETINAPLKAVFFSRVSREKGVEIAVEAIRTFNNNNETPIILDIYGPIQKGYENDFTNVIQDNVGNNIAYKGVLTQNEITETLSKYDFMVFPTYYEGEGFPGAAIDAFIASLPVLASRWKYNEEVITDQVTGLLFEPNNTQDLISKLSVIANRNDLLLNMKINAFLASEKYDTKTVIPKFLEHIGIYDDKTCKTKGSL
ncbi:hypothetical protein AOC36_01375 [Erysipelothrix larvae]|uniref:Glycosyl transferase family 1 domain-containing protein n=1 Tax=Erysipelothrix larvae TaxID=1514105 RepID=A0A109UGI7_9FIRM|nr:glycosyltransferase [Erysipelothrix larvae]AMC92687.1 hypothetical protein AOC36_01375 [Erysipelothrix larvae]